MYNWGKKFWTSPDVNSGLNIIDSGRIKSNNLVRNYDLSKYMYDTVVHIYAHVHIALTADEYE